MRKKLTKILSFFISLLILTVALTMVFVNSEHFQNYLIKKITTYYSSELKCKVEIKHVRFKLTHFELDSVLINDQQGDSLCRIAKLELYPRPSSLLTRKIIINRIVCHEGRFNFMVHPNVKGMNIDFLKKYFLKKSTSKSKRAPIIFDVTNLNLDECAVTYSDKRRTPNTLELDLNYLEFNHLNTKLRDFVLVGDSISANIAYLNLVEKSGLKISNLESHLIICDHEMRFSDFDLKTPYSHITKNLQLTYSDYEDLEEPIDSIIFSGEIRNSLISMKDLRYFNHALEGMTQTFKAEGDFTGHINNLRAKNITLNFGNQTFFKGKARFRGLPEVDETYMDINVEEAHTNYSDLSELLMTEDLPEQVKNMGGIKFTGHFNGFLQDFVTDGEFQSEIGNVTSNINMKIPLDNTLPTYSGQFMFSHFDIGKFFAIPDVGTTNMIADVRKGKGFDLKNLEADLNADISSLHFHGYDYSHAILKGNISNKKFVGKLDMNDPNVQLTFNGKIDLQNKVPAFNFLATIKEAKLNALHFDSNNTVVSTQMNIDFSGSNADNIFGKLFFNNVTIDRGKLHFPIKHIALDADTRTKNGYISLKSDYADIKINGEFDLKNLPQSFQYILYHYLPKYIDEVKKPVKQKFDFQAIIRNSQIVTDLFLPKFKLGNTTLNGKMNSEKNDVSITLNTNFFQWDYFRLNEVNLQSNVDLVKDLIVINQSVAEFKIKDSVSFKNVSLRGELSGGIFDYKLVSFEPRQIYNYDLKGNISLQHDSINMVWNLSQIQIHHKNYLLAAKSALLFHHNKIYLNQFELSSDDENLKANGIVSNSREDALNLNISNFDLSFINAFIKTIDGGIHGKATGTLEIKRALQSPIFLADVICKDAIAGIDTLGDLKLLTTFDDERNIINLDSKVIDGALKGIEAIGDIDVNNGTHLYIDIKVPQTPLYKFNHYTNYLISDVEGTLNATLKLRGSPSNPIVTGKVYVDEARFTVNYIKTRYAFFNHTFDLYDDYIELGRFPVFDHKQKTAIVRGKIYHKNYDQYRLDVYVDNVKNFHCLQTTKKDNDLYYGTAYASGRAHFYGTPSDLAMDFTAKSEKGTLIYFPLGTPEAAGGVDFIHFVKKDTIQKNITGRTGADLSGLRMNFDLELTPDAEIQLIFDEALGDIMKGKGYGNIRMEIDTRRNFNMYGKYVVESGEYLFTALNVFQKKFYVKQGGTIEWSGDPLGAKMNIDARYRVKTSADPLKVSTGVTTGNNTPGSKIYVDCNLYLKGLLFSPDIKFGLAFPEIEGQNSDNNTVLNTILKQIQNDQEELNRQIFSLMMLKQFLPRQGTSSGLTVGSISQGSLNATVSDLISAQMSNWLSQVIPGWEININYNNTNQTQRRQIILELVKSFLDDKLIFQGSITNSDNANPWQYNVSGQYILSKDGRMRIKAFSRTNNNVIYNQNVATHGFGFFYRREFETLRREKGKKITTPK